MAESTSRLLGRVAIVTGGAHGIGRAYATRYAAEGAKVGVLDLDEGAAKEVADAIRANGGDAIGVRADVADEHDVDEAVRLVASTYGGVDILMNNAAVFSVVPMSRGGFEEITVDEWDRLMAVNVKGTWLMCKAVAPFMRAAGSGKIINIGSETFLKGVPGRIHYVASKGAMFGFTHTLAAELGPHGINVNMIVPGSTLSEENADEDTVTRRGRSAGSRALKRTQVPEDLVGTAVFLASSDSDFITGQTIVVNGGDYMH